jgi:hypothetical protein
MTKRTALMMLAMVALCCGQQCSPDSDLDGVVDSNDACPATPLCATVNAAGCPSDTDGDGVYDGCDLCAETFPGAVVHGDGCEIDPEGSAVSRCIGPDPRAKTIEYSLVERLSDTAIRVQIKGTIENIGTQAFSSPPGSQAVRLYEDGVEVEGAAVEFTDLAVDETLDLVYTRDWDQSDEFLPSYYTLIVTYDPDILIDGTTTNDDCRFENNTAIRSTGPIDTLFD